MLILICTNLMAYEVENIKNDVDTLFSIVSDTHEIAINGHIMVVDMRKLINITAMIESNYGRDKYSNRIAKTYMQIEEKSYKYYVGVVPELKQYIEDELGRELKLCNKDAVFISYLIYMAKLQQHTRWIDKFRSKHYNGDSEWYVYKLMYNSLKGASKYSKWEQRVIEYNLMEE